MSNRTRRKPSDIISRSDALPSFQVILEPSQLFFSPFPGTGHTTALSILKLSVSRGELNKICKSLYTSGIIDIAYHQYYNSETGKGENPALMKALQEERIVTVEKIPKA